ncbi:MAG: hypothetical protein AAF517_15145, partial [Planctomycetota bacterium]
AARVKEKYRQSEVGANPWPLVVNMINQTLDLNRVIFYETEAGSTLLKEVRAINCSFDDISERRRDFERSPYLNAVEAGGPIRVEGYLKKSYDREEHYLVPLLFGGEVLGFWACTIEPDKITGGAFENTLRDFASLISELLFQRRQSDGVGSWLSRTEACLNHEHGESLHVQLKSAVEVLDSRVRQLERLLGDISTATVVYDLFGRVLHINDRMLKLLEGERFSPFKMTALDLVASVSDYDLAKSRKILRHVIVEQQVMTIPVTLSRSKDRRYVMHLHPLQINTLEGDGDALRELSGKSILCELVDTTSFTGVFEMKEKLATRLGLQLRNDLASIDLSSSLLGNPNLSADQRQHISQIIHDKVTRTMDVLVECQSYLTANSESEQIDRFPVDSQQSFAAAADEAKPLLEMRDMELVVEEPKLMSYVLASSESLQVVFTAILRLLVSDATDSSKLAVAITESEDLVNYEFKNEGFGIPDDRFQEYLFGDKTLATDELKTLREGISWVEAWGGELEATSEVGAGIEVHVRLVKFI